MAKQRVQIHEKCTSVEKNRTRLYLVWFQEKKRVWESTNEFYYTNPKGAFEKQHNKDIKLKVEALRTVRENQLFKGEIDQVIEEKALKNKSFIEYFENYVNEYPKKDIKIMKGVFKQFKEFSPPRLTAKELTESLCYEFKEYLSERLSGESPSTYFARFKKVVKQATRDKLFKKNPTEDIRNFKTDSSMTKDVLTVSELQMLASTPCGNEQVKKAFLFACNTGLRFVDIKAIKWANLENNILRLEQSKTKDKSHDGGRVEIIINETASKILASFEPYSNKNEIIFSLPTHGSTVKTLKNWAKKAGVEKHVTFHVARHTFGTLLAYFENDILTISKLLGHTSLKHTTKYIRTSNEMKQKAVNLLPNLDI